MAALPYIQLYVSDYLADTMHLTTEEHGAYLLIIMNYWQTGKPVAKNRLAAVARLSNDRWISVEDSLKEMFIDTGTHWQHKRIEADLKMVNEAQEQRSKAGKASAEARKRKKRAAEKHVTKGAATPVEPPLNENSTNKDTDTDTDTDIHTSVCITHTHGKTQSRTEITQDWQPSQIVLDQLHRAGVPKQFAQQQITEFIGYWFVRGEMHEWDAKFYSRVQQEWVRSQKHESCKKPDTDRTYDLEDDSWAVGT